MELALEHYGVKGMKWGVRKDRSKSSGRRKRTQADYGSKELRTAARKNYDAQTVEAGKVRMEALFGDSSISRTQYQNLSDKDLRIGKGHTLNRITNNKNGDHGDNLYVTANKADAERYRAVMPVVNSIVQKVGKKKYKPTFEMEMKTVEALVSPSDKKRVDIFIETMDQPMNLGPGRVKTGREYIEKNLITSREDRKLDSVDFGLKYYNEYLTIQGNRNDKFNDLYFDTVKKKGYNALVDDHDKDVISDNPLIVLNGKTLHQTKVSELSARDINEAQARFKKASRFQE